MLDAFTAQVWTALLGVHYILQLIWLGGQRKNLSFNLDNKFLVQHSILLVVLADFTKRL